MIVHFVPRVGHVRKSRGDLPIMTAAELGRRLRSATSWHSSETPFSGVGLREGLGWPRLLMPIEVDCNKQPKLREAAPSRGEQGWLDFCFASAKPVSCSWAVLFWLLASPCSAKLGGQARAVTG